MSNRILSYKGLLADEGQDTILLSTKKGEIGYRIAKLEVFPNSPGTLEYEGVVKIFKEIQSSIVGTVDFSDNRLLGVGYYAALASKAHSPLISVFDTEIFNQDVYISYKANTGSAAMNYYLELEVIKLDESQAMVATLKDIRNNS